MPYDNTNTASLFRNQRRENNKQPTHTGRGEFGGHDWWTACWPDGDNPGDLSVCMTKQNDQEDKVWFTLHKENSRGSRPDYTGELNGAKVAAWINEMKRDTEKMKKGDLYLGIKFTPPGDEPQGGGSQQGESQSSDVVEDDIPF